MKITIGLGSGNSDWQTLVEGYDTSENKVITVRFRRWHEKKGWVEAHWEETERSIEVKELKDALTIIEQRSTKPKPPIDSGKLVPVKELFKKEERKVKITALVIEGDTCTIGGDFNYPTEHENMGKVVSAESKGDHIEMVVQLNEKGKEYFSKKYL